MMSQPPHAPTRIFPVVDAKDRTWVAEQIAAATAHAVDGVFLIDHEARHDRLLRAIAQVRDHHPSLFLGANFIRTTPSEALKMVMPADVQLDALWTDNAQVGLDGDLRAAVEFLHLGEDLGWSGQHFGGIAFKYQPQVPDEQLGLLGRLARSVVDVPTTSGSGTGQAAPVDKVKALQGSVETQPLALASGVTAENIADFMPYVSHVLVSTSICDQSGRIDPPRLARLIQATHVTTADAHGA